MNDHHADNGRDGKAGAMTRRHPWLLALLIVLLVAAPAYVRQQQLANENRALAECVARWAESQSQRSVAVSDASAERFDQLRTILDAVANQDETAMRQAVDTYRRADSDYREVGRKHPVSKLDC